ncbi:dipeptidase, partial [bacterium]|nr:dipeptidase [bacterium]
SRLHPTAGHPIIVATTPPSSVRSPTAPAVLVYGHYDVQPPDPLRLWQTPPFKPTVRNGRLYGRGASDNKGQFFAHVKAVESYLRSGTPLPVRVMFLLEGEEETGSLALTRFVRDQARHLRADYIVISDTGMFAPGLPTLTYGTRGITILEIRIDGPDRDLHSGVFGGSVANPALALARLLAGCVDARGRVVVPGFYAKVRPLRPAERRALAALPFSDRAYAQTLGVPALAGEPGYRTLERRWARPTFEINGLSSGYQGAGTKTIIPAWAAAKVTCRLVPDQDPYQIAALVTRHLRRLCPRSVRLTVATGHHAPPFLTSLRGRGARAAATALRETFGCDPVGVREGGSLPILEALQRRLRGEILMIGLGLPDDNWHSPNEKMDLQNYHRGAEMSARLLRELGR